MLPVTVTAVGCDTERRSNVKVKSINNGLSIKRRSGNYGYGWFFDK